MDAVEWYAGVVKRTNKAFLPLLWDEHRYLVLKGGAGSGKSIFAGQKILERCSCEGGHRFLVVRKVKDTIKESCYTQLVSQAEGMGLSFKATVSPMRIEFSSGSVILFAGLDNVEKLKSIYEITDIWIEEATELLDTDFRQLDIRMRGKSPYYKQMIITFNPVSMLHWLKTRFWDNRDADTMTHESTYKDNAFLPEENAKVLESFKDSDSYYYTVYCLGEWGVTGSTVFNASAVTEQILKKIMPKREIYFTYNDMGTMLADIRQEAGGPIKIYEEPEDGVPYVIGVDTAGDGSDMNVAQVLDNRTGAMVASMRVKMDEDILARQLICLGKMYNNALIAIETNLSTYPVRELERYRYPRQYLREVMDDATHKIRLVHGFRTDSKSRPLAIATLVKAMRDDPTIVPDRDTLQEMLTFVRSDTFRPEAEKGAHDDCIMALAIAHVARNQQDVKAKEKDHAKVKWTPSMWEDYRNTDAEGKAYLINKWGEPEK